MDIPQGGVLLKKPTFTLVFGQDGKVQGKFENFAVPMQLSSIHMTFGGVAVIVIEPQPPQVKVPLS